MIANSTTTNNTNNRPTHVVVIGGGLAGLSAAATLAAAGADVTIVEKNNHLGGKMNVLKHDGYTFDMGPTILTLPWVLTGIFERAGRNPADYIDLINLNPQWRLFYEDGAKFDLAATTQDTAQNLDAAFPSAKPGKGFNDFINHARRMYRLSEQVFFYKDVENVRDVMRNVTPGSSFTLSDLLDMRLHSTVARTIEKHIKEPHVQQMCEHFLQYVGSSPFLAPSILTMIAAAQADDGCWYAKGGTRAVAQSLHKLLAELNVQTILGTGVTQILTAREGDQNITTGVKLDDGRTINADAVVSNCDVQRTLTNLLNTTTAQQRQRNIAKTYTPACSGLVLYLGLNKPYEHLAHHNFLFSQNSKAEFHDIYKLGIPARDPTLYIAAPSRSGDTTQAPPGGEASTSSSTPIPQKRTPLDRTRRLSRTNTQRLPKGRHQQTQTLRHERHRITNPVERHSHQTTSTECTTPKARDLRPRITRKLTGGFKPKTAQQSTKPYLAGGSVNPGPGVPMVLMSGITAAHALLQDQSIPYHNHPMRGSLPTTPPAPSATTSIEPKHQSRAHANANA